MVAASSSSSSSFLTCLCGSILPSFLPILPPPFPISFADSRTHEEEEERVELCAHCGRDGGGGGGGTSRRQVMGRKRKEEEEGLY